ncbi:unnamed protein product [Eruca vesicaria subsp. sativa]|uniref:UBC core domain-containing protein n=1 Tax=Eruca vesicaria subsp. sativa TaxID=29727 RepID=A0ABC8KMD3_ERUVS|nr:unnamed protein product [Eruca vesicaria subsp. sativa]
MSTTSTSPGESLYKVKTKGIDAFNSDSDDDLATRVLLARSKSVDQLRSNSVDQFRSISGSKSVYPNRRRDKKVRSVSTREKKEDEPQKVVSESKPEPEEETNGIDAINSDSDDDHDLGVDQFRSKSVYPYRRRDEKVRSVSPREKKEDEPQKVVSESKPEPDEETNAIDAINSDSDDDHDLAVDQFRSNSVYPYSSRAEKVRSVSTREKKEDEPQKVVSESKPEPEEEKVGDIVRFGRNSYFVVDIFEKEIMELGDKVDLNFKRFNKFEAVDGFSPRDHHFNNYRCCYSSCCCVCACSNVEREWEKLQRELEKRDGSNGVSFFVKTYNERKELMRVAVTDQSHSVFFFDVKFPIEYPFQAPSLFYHPYGLPLSNFETQLKPKLSYNILDVFLHIEEVVMMNTNKSCHQMLDMLKRPLMGFEDFVKGHFRKKGAFILRNMMEEMDLGEERDKNMFFKTYVAFEDNKTYCEHLLNSELKKELEIFKEKERSLSDYYYSSSSSYFQPITSRFDDIQKTSRYKNLLSKIFLF